mmetsp:Transcript_6156/g.8857  ORF Transcript_6156/g.8857 Transcript_6156/m.8857 type:complete len:94 (+) Transcript_6156:1030-1311(+)
MRSSANTLYGSLSEEDHSEKRKIYFGARSTIVPPALHLSRTWLTLLDAFTLCLPQYVKHHPILTPARPLFIETTTVQWNETTCHGSERLWIRV